jgi:hypothetical protein
VGGFVLLVPHCETNFPFVCFSQMCRTFFLNLHMNLETLEIPTL